MYYLELECYFSLYLYQVIQANSKIFIVTTLNNMNVQYFKQIIKCLIIQFI